MRTRYYSFLSTPCSFFLKETITKPTYDLHIEPFPVLMLIQMCKIFGELTNISGEYHKNKD
jgi:hypothetical protein